MTIRGVGIDVAAVPRFHRLIEHRGWRSLRRWFTSSEVEYCLAGVDPAHRAATTFAIKEAAFKSLRVEIAGVPAWHEIEVIHNGDQSPTIQLHASLRAAAAAQGITMLHVALSANRRYVTATVLATSEPTRQRSAVE